jgi:8-oxo-dGTP diphosphatase
MKIEVSAGGAVYKKEDGELTFLIVQHSGHHRWVLPKGWIDEGETREEAAVREVKEEGGVEAEIEEYIDEITIFYTNKEKEKVRKTSHFFLMKYLKGNSEIDHGWEVENTAWLPQDEAVKKLDYPGEKEILKKAAQSLKESLKK